MARTISVAESWVKVYEAYNQINFTAFDYDTVKQSIVEYIKIYFPESFNDFIESSQFVALIESFAYISEQLIYRVDVGSHENFMSVAQRKQSVLRLAKLISYKATRNLPARGLMKLTSIQTSEAVFDSRGNSLKGRKIIWNDISNTAWREQFIDVINAASTSTFGTVSPNDRVQVDNVLYELYSLNNRYSNKGVVPFSLSVNGSSYNMEIVGAQLTADGPVERRPTYNSALTYLYATDGYGDDSTNTGFFVSFKQGSLASTRMTFDGITPNQTVDITVDNINDTDFWINNVDPDTDAILDDGSTSGTPSGAWFEVDTTTAQNVIFNYGSNKNRYELETLEDDEVRIIFGDGEFATIPSGSFDIWYRVSANEDLSIPQSAITDQQSSITYTDSTGAVQTLQITTSLIANVQNASASEDIDHIRSNAPSVYYTQNRMVNGADYNVLFGKDPSILKVQTVNRTYVGDSKYSYWYDASSTYENVKLFGDDLCVLFEQTMASSIVSTDVDTPTLFANYITPILSLDDMVTYMTMNKVANVRRAFTSTEQIQILAVLANNTWPDPVYINYQPVIDVWTATTVADPTLNWITINSTMSGQYIAGWTVYHVGYVMNIQSPNTMFWNANDDSLISYETLAPTRDQIVILQANINNAGTALITDNIVLLVNGIVFNADGTPDITKLSVSPYDTINDTISGTSLITDLIDPSFTLTPPQESPYSVTLPFTYTKGVDELTVTGILGDFWEEDPTVADGSTANVIILNAIVSGSVTVYSNSFVYYTRVDSSSPWTHVDSSISVSQGYAVEQLGSVPTADQLYMRIRGRDDLNFLWTHATPSYYLVDPSMTNIHDVFIVQKGYYNDFRNWLLGVGSQPVQPTPLQLRSDYTTLLSSTMLSDTVVFHPGNLKLMIGSNSIPQLRAQLVVIKNTRSQLTDSQVKLQIVSIVRDFFDVNSWDFGETFYYTELAAQIHQQMPSDIATVVLVPLYSENFFGDMFQVQVDEDEIIQADIGIEDIVVTTSLTSVNINQVR